MRSPRTAALATLATLLLAALCARLACAPPSGSHRSGGALAPERREGAAPRGEGPTRSTPARTEPPEVAPAAAPGPAPSTRAEAPRVLTCREAARRGPVAGLWLHRGAARVAGPSDEDGRLDATGAPRAPLTLWAPGWCPLALEGAALPEEALVERADAGLELTLFPPRADLRVARTLLEPHLARVPQRGPWDPALEPIAPDRYASGPLRPGTYDLYLWIAEDEGAPRAWTRRGLELEAGPPLRLEVDPAEALAAATADGGER